MKVQLARIAGFCMGVRRAMDMTLEAAQNAPKPVKTVGPLIHNPSAMEFLKARGVEVLNGIPEHGEGTAIVRAHGVRPEDKERLEAAGYNVVDGTCSRVVKVQMIVRSHAGRGYRCILIGDEGHPEVIGIMAHAGEKGVLVSSEEDIDSLPGLDRYIIVAQTTQDRKRFEQWSRRIVERYPGGKVFDTICDSTQKRQAEVRRLASEVDAVVVVGGKQSANTRRLAEIVSECGKVPMAVETEADLDRDAIAQFSKVGVTAGASTPNWIIDRVVREIESIPGADESPLQRFLSGIEHFFHESNLWTAMAGGALAWSVALISAPGAHAFCFIVMACCYIFAMHTLNRLMDRKAMEFSYSPKARFMKRNRMWLAAASFSCTAVSLGIALHIGPQPFFFLVGLSLLGLLYTVPAVPGAARYRSLKNLPGSKTFFVSLAWACVAVLVPRAAWPAGYEPGVWILFVLAGMLVFIRSLLLEVLDLQGDRLLGHETLAIVLGEKKTLLAVRILALILLAGAVFFSISGLYSFRLLSFVPAAMMPLVLPKGFSGRRLGQNFHLELMVEGCFFVFLASAFLVDSFMSYR